MSQQVWPRPSRCPNSWVTAFCRSYGSWPSAGTNPGIEVRELLSKALTCDVGVDDVAVGARPHRRSARSTTDEAPSCRGRADPACRTAACCGRRRPGRGRRAGRAPATARSRRTGARAVRAGDRGRAPGVRGGADRLGDLVARHAGEAVDVDVSGMQLGCQYSAMPPSVLLAHEAPRRRSGHARAPPPSPARDARALPAGHDLSRAAAARALARTAATSRASDASGRRRSRAAAAHEQPPGPSGPARRSSDPGRRG